MKKESDFNMDSSAENAGGKEQWEIDMENEKALREAEKESFQKKRLAELEQKKREEAGKDKITKKEFNRGKFEKAEDLKLRREWKKDKGENGAQDA